MGRSPGIKFQNARRAIYCRHLESVLGYVRSHLVEAFSDDVFILRYHSVTLKKLYGEYVPWKPDGLDGKREHYLDGKLFFKFQFDY